METRGSCIMLYSATTTTGKSNHSFDIGIEIADGSNQEYMPKWSIARVAKIQVDMTGIVVVDIMLQR